MLRSFAGIITVLPVLVTACGSSTPPSELPEADPAPQQLCSDTLPCPGGYQCVADPCVVAPCNGGRCFKK